MSAGTFLRWVAVVPVKALATAKSRLATGSDERRRALAGAFAADTVAALRAADDVRAVVLVCSDKVLVAALAAPGVVLVDEPTPGGLNEAARAGVDWAATHHGDAAIVVLPADLPALRPRDVTRVLRLAANHPRTALADGEGSGTTMLTGLPGSPPRPRFGSGSYAAHLADGAVAIDATGLDRAARDVDTEPDLDEVRRLGVGPATEAVLGSG
ncbi:2-phospho-L-lactate guanylyltransferase [soil metagenome]